ncbi:MAG: T9SS type A sorting domain-containing protein [Cyclobacteriaceae bacterium]|nr:T9SS type A sorting domain-containing protein [Cyclobacteriaceae bacterium]
MMRIGLFRGICLFVLLGLSQSGLSQQVTVSPIFPKANQPLTLTVDVTGTAYADKTGDTYIWTWIPGTTVINAPTNVNPAAAAQAAAKWTRLSANVYQISFTPTTFFNQPLSAFSGNQMGFLLKAADWSGGQTADLFITFFTGFAVQFGQPASSSFFVNNGQSIPITAYASDPSTLVLKIDGNTVQTSGAGQTVLTYNHTVTETSGSIDVEFIATKDGTSTTANASFTYVVRSATVQAPRPAGVVDGINYPGDNTKAILSLWAPGKSSAYVLGDFNNWEISSDYQMKQAGEHFWLEITGLTPGTEYAFQYLVDETLRLADPYADKVLDPDDQYIPSGTYPALKPYPQKARSDKWYYNRVAVLQTGQTPYPWVVTNFVKPPQEKLVIYELLVRDFFDSNNRNYQNLIDTLSYLKRLGVNAIELMPVMEFNGNDSWGYNPTFLFAPDKAYGTKNKMKEFIDKCHQEGIAVILDMVMNQHDLPNPYVMMDFDFTAFKPTANNKWFNVDAKHPFNVFFDMNHESAYTKKYLDTVNHYWLHEYKFDGFRFDLSKGFTQTNNPNDVGAWGQKDPSRIAILKRMADVIWSHTPDAIVILEHFAANDEEKELAEYGMMLWGNSNYNYNRNTIGIAGDSNFDWVYHGTRGWTVPHVVGYMESHDEERAMYRNLTEGLSFGNYNVKDPAVALERMKAISALFYPIPGPKMLWQFGELGYDISINQGGRVSAKPVKWEYYSDPNRRRLYEVTRTLIELKKMYPIFNSADVTFAGMNTLQKQIMLKSVPFTTSPSGPAQMSAVVVGNFDLSPKDITVNFPHTGNWYHYYSGGDLLNVTNAATSLTLQPGEARIYTNVLLPAPDPELIQYVRPIAPQLQTLTELNSAINLSWIDKSGIETGFAIYRKKAGGTFSKVGDVFPNAQFYINSGGLEPLTMYEYYVEAISPYGASASNTLSITTSDQITGLEQEWTEVRVYPNPTKGHVSVELPAALATAERRVINALGQPVSFTLLNEYTIDLSSVPPGLYIVVLTSGGRSRGFKVIKQ